MPLKDNGAITIKLVWDDHECTPNYRVKVINKVDYCILKLYNEVEAKEISWAFHPEARGFKKVDRIRLACDIIDEHLNYAIDNPEESKGKFKDSPSITIELESTQDMVDSKVDIIKNERDSKVFFHDCGRKTSLTFNADVRGVMELSRFLAAVEIVNKELYYIKERQNG